MMSSISFAVRLSSITIVRVAEVRKADLAMLRSSLMQKGVERTIAEHPASSMFVTVILSMTVDLKFQRQI